MAKTEIARAKINLTLHVGRIIEDPHDRFFGYHPLDSLVAVSYTHLTLPTNREV